MTESTLSAVSTFAPLLLLVVVFYFLLIRPQKKQQKTRKDMLNNVKVGDRVTTIGRMYGTVVKIKDDILTVEIGPDNTKLMFDRKGIDAVNEAFDAESIV